MQAVRPDVSTSGSYLGAVKITTNIVERYGFIGLFRGVSAMAAGAGTSTELNSIHFTSTCSRYAFRYL